MIGASGPGGIAAEGRMIGSLGRRAALALPALLLGARAARAEFPDRPVRLVVPAAAGGTADILARLLAGRLGEAWGQPVVVDNRSAGRGIVGTEAVARAAPDGTVLGLFASNHAINPIVFPLPYDTFRDFAPVAPVATAPGVLVVNPARLDVRDLAGAIAAVRAAPGRYNFASPVPLTAGHRSMELIKHLSGTDMQHVPYNGGALAVNDLLAGNVQLLVIAAPSVAGHITSGRLRALAVTSPARFAGMPDLPTVAESGFPGFDSVEWYGVFARAGTPDPIIRRIAADVARALTLPEMRAQLATLGAVPGVGGPDELGAMLRAEYERWRALAREINLRVE